MAVTIKDVKDLNWAKIKLTKSGFDGGVKVFKTSTGQNVALLFTAEDVLYVVDDGDKFNNVSELWSAEDIHTFLIKPKSVHIDEFTSLQNATSIAWYDTDTKEVHYIEELLTKLDINDFSVKEEIREALEKLQGLMELTDIQL